METIRTKIRKFLGIEDLLEESAKWNQELSKFSLELARLREEDTRLRTLIVGEFGKMKPASNEFLDAIFKENRDRLDLLMNVVDSMRDQLVRR